MKLDTIIAKAMLRIFVPLYAFAPVRFLASTISGRRVPEKWVFILGCYNSGTTILKSLLGDHPDIRVLAKEGVRLTGSLPRPEDLGWTRMWIGCPEHMKAPQCGEEVATRVVRDWSPWWRTGGSVFIEKSISNLTRVDWLADNFSNSYFIGITRDGYASAEGIHRRAQPRGAVARRFGGQYPLDWAGRQWVDANSRLIAAREKLSRYHQVSYESLVDDPVATLQEIFDFIGVEPLERLYKVSDEIVVGARHTRLFNGNDRSFKRLSPEDMKLLTPEICDMQAELGYPVRDSI
jgi:hypothetical protein